MSNRGISPDEKRWEQERNARILKDHQELVNNPTKHKEAIKHIEKEMKSLEKVVKKEPKATKATTPKKK